MEDWKIQRLLDKYIHDYMIKNNMRDTAAIFAKEANVCLEIVVINSREPFLADWWGFIWDVYSNRVSEHPEAMEEGSSSKATQNAGNCSNRVSKHPEAMVEGSSSKVSTHGLEDSFPYNFQATQNAVNCSNRVSKHPEAMESSSSKVSTHGPYNFQATQNAENCSQNMNPTMGMPALQDSFPNNCLGTQINAGNWSEDFLLHSSWRDMYDILQNPSPATGFPGLPNHPQTVHLTAMPSPDMEDSQQSTLRTTTRRPELNPNFFGSPSSLDTDVAEGDLPTNLTATSRHQQEHPSSSS